MTLGHIWRKLRINVVTESRPNATSQGVLAGNQPLQEPSKINSFAPDENYEPTLALLNSLAANDIQHVNGTLLPHLIGTYELLQEWGNPAALCYAGLCHAVYGTQNFELQLLTLLEREKLSQTIGREAEQLVYFYASCDRAFVYPQIGAQPVVEYRNRFTQDVFVPDATLLSRFLELTFANELELARDDADFVEYTRDSLGALFARCEALVSPPAFVFYKEVYG